MSASGKPGCNHNGATAAKPAAAIGHSCRPSAIIVKFRVVVNSQLTDRYKRPAARMGFCMLVQKVAKRDRNHAPPVIRLTDHDKPGQKPSPAEVPRRVFILPLARAIPKLDRRFFKSDPRPKEMACLYFLRLPKPLMTAS
jgi:hypothetical protein